jgi:hypothetical protein
MKFITVINTIIYNSPIFSLLSLFLKNKVGLRDHVAVCVSVYPPPLLLTFEHLNQSLGYLVRISRHLSPSQRPK